MSSKVDDELEKIVSYMTIEGGNTLEIYDRAELKALISEQVRLARIDEAQMGMNMPDNWDRKRFFRDRIAELSKGEK